MSSLSHHQQQGMGSPAHAHSLRLLLEQAEFPPTKREVGRLHAHLSRVAPTTPHPIHSCLVSMVESARLYYESARLPDLVIAYHISRIEAISLLNEPTNLAKEEV